MAQENANTKRTRWADTKSLPDKDLWKLKANNEPDSNPIGGSGCPVNQSAIGNRQLAMPLVGWFVVFVFAAALYGLTCNRGVQWQDSGQHIFRVVAQEPINPLGLALSHPLHHYLARFAVALDLAEPCFAVTLVSALAAALAVANTFGCVATPTRSLLAAAFAAASLAIAHTFWQMATRAETYTLAAALLSAELWCLVIFLRSYRPGFLCAAFLFNGLGISNHLLAALTTPVLGVVLVWAVVRNRMRVRSLAVACALWLLGSLPYVVLVFGEWMRTGDATATLRSAFFGHGFGDEALNTSISARATLTSLAFIGLNFPNLLLPFAVYGAARAVALRSTPVVKQALLIGLAIHAVFVLRYPIVDQYTFFVPMYVFLAIFAGLGFAHVQRRVLLAVAFALLLLTPAFYAVLPNVARRFDVLSDVERRRPYRDDYVYLFTPWSIADQSAEQMSRQAVELATPDGLIIAERGEFAVRYEALRRRAVGIKIRERLENEDILRVVRAGRPVVLVPDNVLNPPGAPASHYWKPVGDLFILTRE